MIFDTPNQTCAKFYNPLEHLAASKMIIELKGTLMFKQCIPKKGTHLGIKIYQLCDDSVYTYNMSLLR
jgi:hypothetical protein